MSAAFTLAFENQLLAIGSEQVKRNRSGRQPDRNRRERRADHAVGLDLGGEHVTNGSCQLRVIGSGRLDLREAGEYRIRCDLRFGLTSVPSRRCFSCDSGTQSRDERANLQRQNPQQAEILRAKRAPVSPFCHTQNTDRLPATLDRCNRKRIRSVPAVNDSIGEALVLANIGNDESPTLIEYPARHAGSNLHGIHFRRLDIATGCPGNPE